MNEVIYSLIQPIEYANKGEPVEATFVTLLPPTSRQITEVAFLKQAFYRALPKNESSDDDNEDDKPKPEIKGSDAMALIMSSPDVEFAPVLMMAKQLFASGASLIDGEVKATKSIIDKIGIDDLEAMTGEYLVNFILASLLQSKTKT